MAKIIRNGVTYAGSGATSCTELSYDNETSGLTATDAQGAIDEINSSLGNLSSVATSGSYDDLSNKPDLGTQVTYSLSGTTLTITTK